jgi:pimeloyl-ACP methyl ester carboxylesterase
VNGVRLFYELNGTGEVPLVLVHGSWDSHDDWNLARIFH